jgi:hypothetical protein
LKELNLRGSYFQVRSWLGAARSYLNSREAALAGYDGLSAGWQTVIFAAVLIALFSKCPSLLTHAQFYAEDGMIWFAQAYNLGWLHSLFLPQVGYLNIAPRLGSGLALLFPLKWAPLVMTIVGMLVQVLPVPILLSSRCRNWATLPTRMLLAFLYVALPSSREIHIVLTNAQWHLALAAALVAFASSPRTWRGRLFDTVLLLVAAFTGPYSIVLAPLALGFWWVRRQPWTLAVFALTGLAALTQILLVMHTHRVEVALGATPALFLRMLGGNIVACAIFGSHAFAGKAPLLFSGAAALVGLCIYFYCLREANLEWKLFLLYSGAVYAAALRSPLTEGTRPAWDSLLNSVSARYWFFPMLAFVWASAWCAVYARNRMFKTAGTCVLLFMSIGVVHDWRYGPIPDEHFANSLQHMQDAQPGEHIIMPIVPDGWHMELVKRSL